MKTCKKNLPPQHRTGTVSQGALWDAFPDERSDFFGDFSIIDIEEFSRFVGGELPSHPLLKSMTANDFFRCCAIGYAANGYANCDLSPREQYYKNADGRDEGLGELPPEDPDIFMNWLADRTRYGGHPWEVCAGGNSTHIDLFPRRRVGGYIMEVAGSSYGRCMEAIKFALALYHAGVPVYIHDGETLLARLLGKEKVGIVPQGIFPRYCSSYFPSEHIIEYINLPMEKRAEMDITERAQNSRQVMSSSKSSNLSRLRRTHPWATCTCRYILTPPQNHRASLLVIRQVYFASRLVI